MCVGHEFMGIVEAVGKDVSTVRVGQRVSAEGHLTCGRCRSCREGDRHLCPNTKGIGIHRPGCFAQYISVPEENIFPIPDYVSDEVAAIFDPFGNATHTALNCTIAGEDVLVTGAGPIGAMSVAIARFAGARSVVITDPNPYRLELAAKLGATRTVDIRTEKLDDIQKELSIWDGFSVGLEMSGHPDGLNDLLACLRPGGKIALLGILPPNTLIDWDLVIFKMLTIQGIYGREIFSTWHKMVNMIKGGLDISPVITHRFSYKDFDEAFNTMLGGKSGKIILEWD
jgi:threonine 3-dehydrogenase